MTPRPVTIGADAPLSQALGMAMRTRGFHELPVLRRSQLVGMITLESIARRTNLSLTTKVQHLMVPPPSSPRRPRTPSSPSGCSRPA